MSPYVSPHCAQLAEYQRAVDAADARDTAIEKAETELRSEARILGTWAHDVAWAGAFREGCIWSVAPDQLDKVFSDTYAGRFDQAADTLRSVFEDWIDHHWDCHAEAVERIDSPETGE